AEDPLQSGVRPMFRRKDTLQELVVRVPLDLQQVGNVDELANPTERASDAEVICQLQSHYCCSPNSRYLSSTAPPASSSFFFIASASAFAIPSLTGLGALSTRSLASFKPRLVSSRTTFMTLIFFSRALVNTTSNSFFSGAAAGLPVAAAVPAPPEPTTG